MVAVEVAEADNQQEVEDGIDPAIGARDVWLYIPVVRSSRRQAQIVAGTDAIDCAKMMGITPDIVHLDGQVRVLATIDLPADHALGVLDGDAALGVVDETR